MSISLEPKIVAVDEWLERIARFRVEVWRANGMISPASFPEGVCVEAVDLIATHFIIEHDAELIGACRYVQYPDVASSHHAEYYKAAGIELQGPIGIPEHTVVHPDRMRLGLGGKLASAQLGQAIAHGARYMISEAAPAAASMLRKRGRKSLGMAPLDARFPSVQFEWMLTDIHEAMNRQQQAD